MRKVTTVLEPNSANDTMDKQYIEVTLMGKARAESREADIKGWKKEFHDILTKDPGTTDLAKFKIDTGDHPPISQAPIRVKLTASTKSYNCLKIKGS